MIHQLLTVRLQEERDVVLARQRARQVAVLVRMDALEQTRLATAVSEVVRNAFRYARQGMMELSLIDNGETAELIIRVTDKGPGIPNLKQVLAGDYQSHTGMGLGLIGSQRLVDAFHIESSPEGTIVVLKKTLPRSTPPLTRAYVGDLVDRLARERPGGEIEEVQRQNQELLAALEEVRRRQSDLERLNHELEDTNRGVVALYAELDDRAEHLRQADDLKTRFLNDMSHEFRTPLSSIVAIARILIQRFDGPLNDEQGRQVQLIESSALDLLTLVDDLLDLARVDAGKTEVRLAPFAIEDMFGALRGMLRPLQLSPNVRLVFDDAQHLPELYSDQAKLSQILRNFISNALKFTENGEVHISAAVVDLPGGPFARFVVSDTGIGIAPEHLEHIFTEFGQVDSHVQRRVKGTGLGLPLTRKLARLLGGHVSVKSTLDLGSSFTLEIPQHYSEPESGAQPKPRDTPV